MVFPIVDTVESACEILNISIEFNVYLGAKTTDALKATKNKYKLRNKKSVPKNINRYLKLELEDRISGSDLEVAENRLTNLFSAVVPLQDVIESSRKSGSFPKYGQAIHLSLRKIHNSLYEWGCFEGIHTHSPYSVVQKMDFFLKTPNAGNKGGSKSKAQATSGSGESRRILLEAKSTLQSIQSSDLGHKLDLKPRDKIYFGLGEASHMLYLHDCTEQDGFVTNSRKIIFQGHNAKVFPLLMNNPEEISTDRSAEKGGDKESEAEMIPTRINKVEDLSDEYNSENRREDVTDIKVLDYILTRRDFILISRGLLQDLMIYSKLSRDEGIDTKISFEKSSDEEKQYLRRIVSLWLNFFNMPPEILNKEAKHSNLFSTLLNVALSSIFAGFSLPIFLSYRSPNFIKEYLSVNNPNQPQLYLGGVIFLLFCLILLFPFGFYIYNGLVFLSAKLLGVNEGFDSQTYLVSILTPPIGILILLGLLLIKIPVIGIFMGITLLILVLLYASLLFIRVVQIVYLLPTLKAVVAVAIPTMLVTIFLLGGIALFALFI